MITDQALSEILDFCEPVAGWMPRPLLRELAIAAYEVSHESGNIFEVGTYRGRTTCALAMGSKAGAGSKIFTIDPHNHTRGVLGGKFGPSDFPPMYDAFSRCPAATLIHTISLPSAKAAKALEGLTCDLLLLDGDHSAEAVSHDVEVFLGNLRNGSRVFFDDSNSAGVKSALLNASEWGLEFVRAVGKLHEYRFKG